MRLGRIFFVLLATVGLLFSTGLPASAEREAERDRGRSEERDRGADRDRGRSEERGRDDNAKDDENGRLTSFTNTFVGTATTGVGQPFPVQLDCDRSEWLSGGTDDGRTTYGIPYTYLASGAAQGDLPGTFVYEEQGWMFVVTPDCPTVNPVNQVGSQLKYQEIRIDPANEGRANIQIRDEKVADFTFTTHVVPASELMGDDTSDALRGLRQVLQYISEGQSDQTIVYNTWTFTSNDDKTVTGYASHDFRQIAITLTFRA